MAATRTAGTRGRATAGPSTGALPNLIVIGAMKCGTSALHYYLDLHPEIEMSSPKELNFFCADPEVPRTLRSAAPSEQQIMRFGPRAWDRGPDWYATQFSPGAGVRGEASPNYTAPWHPGAAKRMASLVPDAKLIFMVRDPLEQIVSQYMHYRHVGNEPRGIEEALSEPHGIYLERARYHARLAPFLEHFPSEQVLVVSQEELSSDRRPALARVFGFLGVEETFWSPKMERARHRSGGKGWRARLLRRAQYSRLGRVGHRLPQEAKWYLERLASSGSSASRPSLPPELRDPVASELANDVAALRAQTGLELRAWSL